MSDTFLRRYHRILIWMIWLMPLSAVTGRLFAMDGSPCFYLALAASGIYLLLLLIHERTRAVKEYLPELMVLAACALSTYLNRQNSSIDSLVRYFELLIYILALCAYPLSTAQKEARKDVKLVLEVTYLYLTVLIVTSLILQAVYSLTGFETSMMTYLDRGILGGLFGNSNQLGISAYLALMLGLFLFSEKHRTFAIANTAVMLAAIVLSQARSVFVALVMTALIYLHHHSSEKNRKRMLLAAILLVLSGVLLLLIATLRKSVIYTEGGRDYELLDQLSGNRYLIWREALWVWKTYFPWFGVGLANLHQMVTTLPSQFDPTGPNPYAVYNVRGYENAHNLIVNILGYTGIFGMICFLILFRKYQNCWNTRTVRKKYQILRTMCICLIIMDLFDVVLLFDTRMPAYLFCLLAGFFRVCAREDENRKVYFVSNLVDEKDYWKLYTKKEKPGQQVQKFDRLIVNGLQKNKVQVRCYSAAPASRAVMKPFVTKLKNHGVFHYSICWTIPGFKDLWNLIACFFKVLFAPSAFCIIDPLSAANSLGAAAACRIKGQPCMAVVTDLPEFMTSDSLYQHIVNLVIRKSSCYVFLAEKMNEKLNPEGKPYVQMEGLCDPDEFPPISSTHNRSIIYAGNLDDGNGAWQLIQAFQKWNPSDFTLEIYGDGDDEERIRNAADASNRIFFGGLLKNSEVVEKLSSAALLVNPRPTSSPFVQYSFPSKTLEYMASGTPFASTRLPSIPEEYFRYIGSLGSGSAEEILDYLVRFSETEYSGLLQRAEEARMFVQDKKNNQVQTLNMLKVLRSQR